MKLFTILVALAAVTASAEWKPNDQLRGWQDLKGLCKNPTGYGAQVAPQNITVTCSDLKRTWEVIEASNVLLPTERVISIEAASSKGYAKIRDYTYDSNPVSVDCPQVAQVELIYTEDFNVTCEEVLAFPGTFPQFCAQKLDTEEKADLYKKTVLRTKSICLNKKY